MLNNYKICHPKRMGIAVVLAALFVVLSGCFYCCSAIDITSIKCDSCKVKININNDNTFVFKESISLTDVDVPNPDEPFDVSCSLAPEYKGRVSDIEVKAYDYDYDAASNLLTIHVKNIGTNNELAFEFSYVVNGINNLGKKNDEFDLYVIPSGRSSSIDSLNISIHYPDSIKWSKLNYSFCDEEESEHGKWIVDRDNNLISFKGSAVPADSAVSLCAVLPAGYWSNAVSIGATKTFALWLLIGGSIFFILIRLLLRKENRLEIHEEYYAQEGISPAHAAYLIDNTVGDDDIVSLLYYMGQKGYLEIIEYERRKFSFRYLEYPKNDTKTVKIMFEALFENCSPGDSVKLEDVSERIYKQLPRMKNNVPKDLFGGNRFYSGGSKVAVALSQLVYAAVIAAVPALNFKYINLSGGRAAVGLAVVILIAMIMTSMLEVLCSNYFSRLQRKSHDSNRNLLIAVLIYVALSIFYVYFFRFAYNGRVGDMEVAVAEILFLVIVPLMRIGMKTRSKANAEMAGHVIGLQNFMKNCSKERIKELSDEDKEYYFKLMPYAYVLNISRKFAGCFEYVDLPKPSWYKAYGLSENYPFDIVVVNSMISNLPDQMNKEVFSRNVHSQVTR